jgi:hypothetical protein
MASSRIRLDPPTVEAIARRVVGLLREQERAGELIDAAELARRLGVERSWVYTHAIELGAVKLGQGPRPRLRFDPGLALARFRGGVGAAARSAPTKQPTRRDPSRGSTEGSPRLLPIKGGGDDLTRGLGSRGR